MATKYELQAQVTQLSEQLCRANADIAMLRSRLNDADIRAKRLIAASNRRTSGNPERRASMEKARQIAMEFGQVVKV